MLVYNINGKLYSYLNVYGNVEGSFPVNTEMDISDSAMKKHYYK